MFGDRIYIAPGKIVPRRGILSSTTETVRCILSNINAPELQSRYRRY